MRGNRLWLDVVELWSGSIPACAGEPSGGTHWTTVTTVYPRVCGGTMENHGMITVMAGLSPRVRGNQYADTRQRGSGRSIPACAGEPNVPRPRARRHTVYPRVCGGTAQLLHQRLPLGGLSPRVRGNQDGCDDSDVGERSIPACAGEPGGVCWLRSAVRVYPRVCGGTNLTSFSTGTGSGLSPRVRGNHNHLSQRTNGQRSIPACAGGTSYGSIKPPGVTGLSPRVRGNHPFNVELKVPVGSIPACAGEPAPRRRH